MAVDYRVAYRVPKRMILFVSTSKLTTPSQYVINRKPFSSSVRKTDEGRVDTNTWMISLPVTKPTIDLTTMAYLLNSFCN